MLKVKEFTVTHTLSASDGRVIQELEDEDFAVLYDDDVCGEDEVNGYISEYIKSGYDFPDDIVVLPLDTWTRLQGMIKNNYDLSKKDKKVIKKEEEKIL